MPDGFIEVLEDIQNKTLRLGPNIKPEGLSLFNELSEDLHKLRQAFEGYKTKVKKDLLNKIQQLLEE